MKKVLILYSENRQEDFEDIHRMFTENSSKNIDYDRAYLDDCIFVYGGDSDKHTVLINNVPIDAYDLVIFRKWMKNKAIALALANFLKSRNIPFIDELVGHGLQGNKLSQSMILHVNNLPIPRTMFVHSKNLPQNLKHVHENFDYPLIFKSVSGREGYDNYLVHSDEELLKISDENTDKSFLIQEYIPNTGDYRVVTLDYKIASIYFRTRLDSSTHLNNVSQGGSVTFVEEDSEKEICEIAQKSAQIQKKNVAGVDIVRSTKNNQLYILEVNAGPGLSQKTVRQSMYAYLNDLLSKE